jgi:hypothetical protein
MRIKIWASMDERFPNIGPYKMLDIVEEGDPYAVDDMTHYGEVLKIPPAIPLFTKDADQSVIVKLNPASLVARPDESVFEKPPSNCAVHFTDIFVSRFHEISKSFRGAVFSCPFAIGK